MSFIDKSNQPGSSGRPCGNYCFVCRCQAGQRPENKWLEIAPIQPDHLPIAPNEDLASVQRISQYLTR